ncbi:MAG: glycosyltransferase family 4 protein [Bacteroidetes bacterium]|nr:glycosyltransferase family 4 protein [Bacteroidota bacterium]
MKILYVSAIELDVDGGPKTHIIEMLRAWHTLGHDIFLLTPRFDKRRLNLPGKVMFYPFFGYSFLRRIISYIFLFAFLIWSIHKFNPDLIYVRQMEYNPFVRIVCRIFRLTYFLEINGLITEDLEKTGSRFIPIMIHKVVEKKEFYSSTGMFCTSPLLKKRICEKYNNIRNKIFFIPNGVNLNIFKPLNKGECRIKKRLDPEMKYIGYVGTFNHLHDSEQIVESFENIAETIPEAQLVMVGDGPRKKECQKRVARFNLTKRVIFTGSVPYEDVPIYINCFDIGIILASKHRLEREGVVAFKLQEFLACGCPTIAHYKDQKDHEKYSPFVKMVHIEDRPGLLNAVIELLQSQDKCSELTRSALSYIKNNVSWEKSAKLTVDFINQMVKSKQVVQ